MSVYFATALASVFVVTILVGGMVLGVFLRGKPIRHCGSASINGEGECSACGARESCTRRSSKPSRT